MRSVVEISVWWVLGTGVWLLGLSAVTTNDLVLGVLVALLAAVAAAVGRRLVGGQWRPRARWARQIPRIPAAIVGETATVFVAALAERGEGEEHRVHLPHERAAGRRDAREALATMAVSASPGSYVVDSDPDSGDLLVHTFGAALPRWARFDPEAR